MIEKLFKILEREGFGINNLCYKLFVLYFGSIYLIICWSYFKYII